MLVSHDMYRLLPLYCLQITKVCMYSIRNSTVYQVCMIFYERMRGRRSARRHQARTRKATTYTSVNVSMIY